MDTLTHALVGAVAARATAPVSTSAPTQAKVKPGHLPLTHRMLIGGIAAAFPDSDYLSILINPLTFISDWHRAETHSLIMLPIWALLLGLVFATLSHRRSQWREFALICALSLFTHILTDLITSWGTQIFAPLSKFAPALSLTFVIDPYFTTIMAVTLLIAIVKHSGQIARIGLVVLTCYVGLQAVLKQNATGIGHDYARAMGLNDANVYAMPQPFSPFYWKLIVTDGKRYHMAYVDLIASAQKPEPNIKSTSWLDIPAHYRSTTALHWQHYSLPGTQAVTQKVWWRPELERYRRFARYPALYRIDESQTDQCVWFMDLRFTLPTQTVPFRYGMCRQAQFDWRLYRLKGLSKNAREAIHD